jgi:polyhydroxybutyrate depolymerase
MRIVSPLFTTLILFFAACSSDPASKSSSSGGTGDGGTNPKPASDKVTATEETLDVGGTARKYVLAVPKNYDDKRPYPLVLVFHGDGGTGPGMRQAHLFDAYSSEDAIVAYPTGQNQAWDIYSPTASNADIQFIEKLVTTLQAKYTMDPQRVFATGYSSGAFFINKVACRKTGYFRAIVPYAGGAPDEPNDPEAGIWPFEYTKCAGQTGGVAAMVVHGAADTEVTPDSGDFTATYWAAVNECSESRSDTKPSPCVKYDGCPKDKPVLFCLIPGLGHSIWDQGAKEAWSFMKQF